MAASISEDEFHRLQAQILDLRTKNYNLEDRFQKQNIEITRLKSQNEYFEKELSKAQKALNRSKKARDVEQLIQDNENLERKLQNQEDEFRLQNSTIMQELSLLVSTNEKLEKELEALRNEVPKEENLTVVGDTDEIRRLQAEKAALQKSLTDAKNLYEAELSLKSTPPREASVDSDESTLDDDQKLQAKELSEVKLLLYTETEEKRILKEQLANVESNLKERIRNLEEENKKVTEKLKKKQESVVQLQDEKETLFREKTASYDELKAVKDREIEGLKEKLNRLQIQLNNATQTYQERSQKYEESIKNLQEDIFRLKNECDEQSRDAMLILEAKLCSAQSELDRLNGALNERSSENKLLQCHLDDSQSYLKDLEEKYTRSESLRCKAEDAAAEAVASAEKRKKLLDEMAVHLQEDADKHREEIRSLTLKFNDEIESLRQELKNESLKHQTLNSLEKEVILRREEIKSNLNRIAELENSLKREKNAAELATDNYEKSLEQKTLEHNQEVNKIKEEHEQTVQLLTSKLEESRCNLELKEIEIAKYQQEVKDSIEDCRITERKGLSMVKELKKQLHSERKRGDKLQERLQEFLSETSNGKIEDVILPGLERSKGDASSVSSWSFMSANLENRDSGGGGGGGSKEGSKEGVPSEDSRLGVEHTGTPEIGGGDKSNDADYNELLARLTSMQEEKWILEEKINHLETSNAAMVEDIMAKTAIIQFYCMEGRTDARHLAATEKLTVKRIVDFIKDKGDENLKEMNRKMQRMLEETLSKNMFLQKDLEILSNQVVQLSKITGNSVEGSEKYSDPAATASELRDPKNELT